VADGRVVAALRRSSRPPKAGAPLPAELATALAAQAGEALNAEATPDRWAVVLDALSFSPVRTSVKPVSIPETKPEELLVAVRKSAARLPAIATLFGVEADGSGTAGGRGRRVRPSGRPAGATGSGPRIPPPPAREEAAGDAPVSESVPMAAAEEARTEDASLVESVDVERMPTEDEGSATGVVSPPPPHHAAQPHVDVPTGDEPSLVEALDPEHVPVPEEPGEG
jgi:hypothetical protein